MSEPEIPESAALPGGLSPKTRRWLYRVGGVVSILLFIAALVVVWQQREMVGEAIGRIRITSWLIIAALLAAVAVNVALTGIMFRILKSRYGYIGWFEMGALIASATLLNYLPLRPGLAGRIVYHKAVNQIAIVDSLKVLVQASLMSAAIAVYFLLIIGLVGPVDSPMFWFGVLVPLPVLALLAIHGPLRVWTLALFMRHIDLLVWMARYELAFHLLDLEISAAAALTLACVSAIASMVPFVSNGLGLREWAIGLLAPVLAGHALELGVTAELLNRAAEMLVVVVLGVPATIHLAHRHRAYRERGRTRNGNANAPVE